MTNLWDSIAQMRVGVAMDGPTSADTTTTRPTTSEEGSTGMPRHKKAQVDQKTIRYTPGEDIMLLRDILSVNPFEDGNKWCEVAANFNTFLQKKRPGTLPVNSRSVRERADKLIKAFKKEELSSLRKSGTAEEYAEREVLLTEIGEVIESEKTKGAKKGAKEKEKEDDLANAGLVIRKRAMETLVANKDESGRLTAATPKKSKKGVAYEYANMKMVELEVRREELAFRKHEMEMKQEERRERMELERKEKEGLVNLLQGLVQVIKEK